MRRIGTFHTVKVVTVRSAMLLVIAFLPSFAWAEGANEKDSPSTPQVIENSIGMKLVLVPSGEFQMGLEEPPIDTLYAFRYASLDRLEDEMPRHRVRLTKPFYMGAYETTLREFLIFYHAAKYKIEAERDQDKTLGYDAKGDLVASKNFRPWQAGWTQTQDHPAVYVSWNDAVAFCKWLSQKERKRYRLPTEAEWEYACRAGTTARYSCGNDPKELVSVGNVLDQDHNDWIAKTRGSVLASFNRTTAWYSSGRDGYAFTAPVGRFRPNALGLYDMHGNVGEWCQDRYDERYYDKSPVDDPVGPPSGDCRVVRGGSWERWLVDNRSAHRLPGSPVRYTWEVGFRVVCEVE